MSKGQNVFQTHRREDVSLAGQVRAVVSPSDLLEARASIQRSRRQRHGNNSRTTFCPGCGGPKSLRAKRCMDCRVEAMSAAQRQAKAAGRRTTAHRADQLLPRVVARGTNSQSFRFTVRLLACASDRPSGSRRRRSRPLSMHFERGATRFCNVCYRLPEGVYNPVAMVDDVLTGGTTGHGTRRERE
jgi:predicted amidophosphoribosyltransferase